MNTKKTLAVLLCFLLLLSFSACSRDVPADERIGEIRAQYQQSEQRFNADITADYGEHVHQFRLHFDSANASIEVLAPDIISGITIALSEGGTILHFEGAVLDTGPLTEDGLSPLAALPMIVSQWKDGHILTAHYETFHDIPTIVMQTAISDRVRKFTWFDNETGFPIKSELFDGGTLILTVAFEGSPLFGLHN